MSTTLVGTSRTTVVSDGGNAVTVSGASRATLVADRPTGPQGPAGATGAAGSVLAKTASAAIGGHRVVVADGADGVLVADPTSAAHLHSVLGVTESAAVEDDAISVRFAGEMTEGSWNWTPDAPIYAGVAGVLTQTPPVGVAWLRIVAVAVSPTRIVVGLREPVALAS